ncbi:MAG: VOC family protein [Rhodospirillales bacterium]|nr:VOC family protein [Rhodospirillales bacterium]
MAVQIFVNLAVDHLDRSIAFFKRLGFTFNPQFTDETAACMVIADGIHAMLVTRAKFKLFTNKDIADAHKTTEVLTCLAVESKARVDEIVGRAIEAGGNEPRPAQDHGFMFLRSFDDLDGHIWEIVWMDPQAVAQAGG